MVESTIDCLDEVCPMPLARVRKQVEKMTVGDVPVTQTDRSYAMENVPEWVRDQRYNVKVEEVDDGEWEIMIKKTEQKGYRWYFESFLG